MRVWERGKEFLCEERGLVDRGKKDGGMMEKPQRILQHKQSFESSGVD